MQVSDANIIDPGRRTEGKNPFYLIRYPRTKNWEFSLPEAIGGQSGWVREVLRQQGVLTQILLTHFAVLTPNHIDFY